MRLWSLNPCYLDRQGLGALWREGLLAQKVLLGATRGYRSHPQLQRFQCAADPLASMGTYLLAVVEEARQRGYSYDASKIIRHSPQDVLRVTDGQVGYEWSHLQAKLQRRSPLLYERTLAIKQPLPHPLFEVIPGGIESWERV